MTGPKAADKVAWPGSTKIAAHPALAGRSDLGVKDPFPLPIGLSGTDRFAEVHIGTTPLGFSLDLLEKFLRSSANLIDYDALCRACSTVERIPSVSWPAIIHEHRHLVPPKGILVYTDGVTGMPPLSWQSITSVEAPA